MTLTEFLLARIAEDEAVALAATPGPWRHNPRKEWFTDFDKLRAARAGVRQSGGEEYVAAGSPPIGVAITGPASHPQSMKDGAHIARHNPARVLAECEAKRVIVWLAGRGCGDDYERVQHALALPYAEHADYCEEWRI